ncbi:MAG: hypothetical protein FHP92_17865 [Denitromonas halophila]|nr:MAG: hypothetical protein FHP92_17865 [Denitromonas halophila]
MPAHLPLLPAASLDSPPKRNAPPAFTFEAVSVSALDAAVAATDKLLALVAPVGYGKTVFMGALHARLRALGEVVFWVGLDERDDSVEAVLHWFEELAYRHSEQLHPTQALFRGDSPLDARLDALVAAASAYSQPFTLFVDNLNSCEEPGLATVLNRLVFETPSSVRFVFSSTQALPFDMARARLAGLVQPVGPEALSLDDAAVEQVLGPVLVRRIGGDGVSTVTRLTEGWPAAVRLAQIVLAEAADPRAELETFSGADEDLASLLNRQVLAGVSPGLRDFLLGIAPLRGVSAELCRAALEDAEADRHLDDLLARNLFIIPLDRNRQWYRLHTLFRQYLISESERRLDAATRQGILSRAARWLAKCGQWQDAIDYALQAGDSTLAANLLNQAAAAVVRQGELRRYIDWVDRLRQQGQAIDLDAEYWYVWALVLGRRYEAGRKEIERVRPLVTQAMAGEARDGVALQALQRRLVIAGAAIDVFTDRLPEAHEGASQWLAQQDIDDAFDATAACCVQSIYLSAAHRFVEARDAVQRAHGWAYQTDSIYANGWLIALNALPALHEGNYALIGPELATSLDSLMRALGEGAGICGTIALMSAHCAMETGDAARARELLALGLRTAQTHGFVDALAFGFDAAVKCWTGAPEDPIDLTGLRQIAAAYPARLATTLSCALIRGLVRLDRLDDARAEAARIGLDPAQPEAVPLALAIPAGADAWRAACIALAVGEGRGAQLEPLIEQSARQAGIEGRSARQVELVLIQMHLSVQSGQPALANRHLLRAINLAAGRGIVRPFLDHGTTIARLVDEARADGWGFALMQERRFFADICRRLPVSEQSVQMRLRALNLDARLIEPLSSRQSELLSLLDAGLSNQQIADRLHVTVSTVKGHLQKLYAKLGVPSRTAALARARGIGLV